MVRLSVVELKRNDFILSVDKIFDTSSSYALMGENGSGKTTLLDLIAGLITPDRGIIEKDVKIAYSIAESVDTFFLPTVYDEFKYTFGRMKKSLLEEKTAELLSYLSLDESFLYRSPFSLSGGEKRLLSIALTLAQKPEFILFDESLAGLDYKGYLAFKKLLMRLKDEKIGFIIVTHDNSILDLVDDLLILKEGKISFDGKVIRAMEEGRVEKSFCFKESMRLYNKAILSLDDLIARRLNG